ncbi:MAG: DUF262 domain-containing protein [Tepidisphaeraceae bacterium]|jgi:hypothetical protein
MPSLSNGMTDRRLKDIFEWIEHHELALPELQRPSVWADHKIPDLLSSVYHDFPFGIFLLWTPKQNERIHCRPFVFQNDGATNGYDTKRRATHYLIDGQQRLTSFYRTLRSKPTLTVAFNLKSQEFSLRDAKIKASLKNPKESCWYELNELLRLDTPGKADLMQTHESIGKEHLEDVLGKLSRLKPDDIKISFYNIQEKSYADVCEIFERINLGTPVTKSQIYLGKLSTKYQGVVSEVEAYLEKMRTKNGCKFDLDVFLSSLSVVATEYDVSKFEANYLENEDENINAADVKRDIKKTQGALEKALRFVETHLYIDTMKYFRSERTLTCLSFLFANAPGYMAKEINRRRIAYWTALALLTEYHSDNRRFVQDLAIIRECDGSDVAQALLKKMKSYDGLKRPVNWKLSLLSDLESPISRNNVLFCFLYAMVRWNGARSFFSRTLIRAGKVANADEVDDVETSPDDDATIHEHHIYPVSRLRQESEESEHDWITKEWIYDLANFTFLTGHDNTHLKDPEIDYVPRLARDMRKRHLINPRKYRSGDYERFLQDRRKLIKSGLEDFLGELERLARLR